MRIEGYFGSIKNAKEAAGKLKGLGFKEVIVDMNEHYNEDRNVQTNLPGTETSVSLSGLVLESDTYGAAGDKAPLEAASPMASGSGTFEEIADVNCKVVVKLGEKDVNRAKQVIQEMGGSLESPNIRKPKLRNDEEIAVYGSLRETREFVERRK